MLRVLSFFYPRHMVDWILYLVIVPITCICVYWAVFDTKLTLSSESEIASETVRQGDLFVLRYNVVWSRDCRLTGHRFIIDSAGQRYEMDEDVRYVQRGSDRFEIAVPIPLAAAPGRATYRAQLLSECNPWQRFVSPLVTNVRTREFQIQPGQPAAGGVAPATLYSPGTLQCGGDKPIRVEAFCRARPNMRRASVEN